VNQGDHDAIDVSTNIGKNGIGGLKDITDDINTGDTGKITGITDTGKITGMTDSHIDVLDIPDPLISGWQFLYNIEVWHERSLKSK
jgi:hypothetical protein